MTSLLEKLRDPRNQPISSWIQTICIVGGVVFTVWQVETAAEQISMQRNVRYVDYMEKFDADVAPLEERIWQAYRVSRGEEKGEIDADQVIAAADEIRDFMRGLARCGGSRICPEESVDDFICRQSGAMFRATEALGGSLSNNRLMSLSGVFNYYRNQHCSLFRRVLFLLE
jgi:hypothetical protein